MTETPAPDAAVQIVRDVLRRCALPTDDAICRDVAAELARAGWLHDPGERTIDGADVRLRTLAQIEAEIDAQRREGGSVLTCPHCSRPLKWEPDRPAVAWTNYERCPCLDSVLDATSADETGSEEA